ncbi:Uncharacterised protein [Neisseria animalis]|nr:Uncharacterised protein [Neisseria animalis]
MRLFHSLFGLHTFELIDQVSVFENEKDRLPPARCFIQRCRVCGKIRKTMIRY